MNHRIVALTMTVFWVGIFGVAWANEPLSEPLFEVTLEKDVVIEVRDGTKLYADIYRPDDEGRFPVLVAHSPYQKDLDEIFPKPAFGWQSREMPEAAYFVPRGYVIVRVDVRGVGRSEGEFEIVSAQEAEDIYDVIEWSAQQPWSNGKTSIGGGVGYYSMAAWNVASLKPPHLTAMLSWDGSADIYRDMTYRGGMFFSFVGDYYLNIAELQHFSDDPNYNPAGFANNLIYDVLKHPLDGEFWASRRPKFDQIDIPVFMTESWEVLGAHGRHNIEAFYRMRELGKQKTKLRIHDNHNTTQYPGSGYAAHTNAFFSEEGQLEQLRWYDYWLKGIDTGVMDEPAIKVWVRRGADAGEFRFYDEWPLPNTEWRRYYLTEEKAGAVTNSINDGLLSAVAASAQTAVGYPTGPEAIARSLYIGEPTLSFVTSPMKKTEDVIGPVVLKLWVSSESDDMDIFAHLLDMAPDGSVDALSNGWLKVSHRRLDPDLSRTFRPFHSHDREEKMVPGDIYEVDVEIWPTAKVFEIGHRIRLDIAPYGHGFYPNAQYKHGAGNKIFMGGKTASFLQLPVIKNQ